MVDLSKGESFGFLGFQHLFFQSTKNLLQRWHADVGLAKFSVFTGRKFYSNRVYT